MATMNSIDSSKGRLRGTYIAIMIPLGVAINYVGGQIASSLGLPIYLDSIGTVIVAAIMGPWVGAISGALYKYHQCVDRRKYSRLLVCNLQYWFRSYRGLYGAGDKKFHTIPHVLVATVLVALWSDCRFAHRNGCLRRCGRQYRHQFDDCGPAGVRAGSDGRRIPCPYPCQSSRQGHCLLHRMDYSA